MKLKIYTLFIAGIITFSFQQQSNAQGDARSAILEAKRCMDDRLQMIRSVPRVAYSTTTFASDLVFEECMGENATSLMSTRSTSGVEMISKIRILLLAAWVKRYPNAKIDPTVRGKVDEYLRQVKSDSYFFKIYTAESDDSIKRELALIRPVLAASSSYEKPPVK